MKIVITVLLLSFILAGTATAQSIEFSGQFRERSEFNDKSFNEDQHSDVYHFLRTRLKATATVNEQVKVVLEAQDARVYGEESSTFNSGAAHLDLRQGYLELTGFAGGLLSGKLGRQALVYANQRFIGAIDWHNYGQTFDAGVLRVNAGAISIDALGAAVSRNSNTPEYMRDVFLTGVWGKWSPAGSRQSVQAFFLFDTPNTGTIRQNRQTAGLYAGGHFGMFDYEVDAAVQMGDFIPEMGDSRDISANMVGIRAGYRIPFAAGLRIGVGFDMLSGQDFDDMTTYGAFHTLYATNHKYYGYMDYFLNIPNATSGMGLQDIIIQLSAAPVEGLKIGADVHLFSTAVDPADVSNMPESASKTIGTEIDITAKWKVAKIVGMTLGYSMFSGDENRIVLTGTGDSSSWAYLMTMVNF